MEKFAIKIDENVRLRLYKICRLCGTDNRNNSEILEGERIISDGEPDFHKKILDCVGIQVTRLDKMPQTVCDLCRDKINDFFEFREMCVTTDVQTRRLLGLPPVCITKTDPAEDVKVLVDDKDAVEKTIKKRKYTHKKVKEERKQPPDIKKKLKTENAASKQVNGRKRKAPGMNLLAEKPPNKRERLRENQINRKSKQPLPLTSRPELAVDGAVSNVYCAICDKPFYNAGELHRHLDWDHVPRIATYHCVRCNETISDKLAIKNHNLWHKLSKTPYECGLCSKLFNTLVGYTRHTQCCLFSDPTVRFDKKTCELCRQDFVTQNLYNWHSCVLAKLTCPICQCTFSKKLATLKHILRCSPQFTTQLATEFEMPDDEPFDHSISDDSMSIHDEINIKPDIEIEIDVPRKKPEAEPRHFVVIPPGLTNSDSRNSISTVGTDENMGTPIHADAAARNSDTAKSSGSNISRKKQPAIINVKKEPGVNIPDIESNINVTNSNQDSDSVVNNSELASMSLRIKAEIINPDYQGLYEPEISVNIKQERIEEAQTVGPPKPTLKLVIKKEHGTLNSSFVRNSGSSSDPEVSQQRKKKKKSKKIFKIPKGLAMKIKQEKMDGYEEQPINSNVTMPIISQVCSGSDLDRPAVNVSDGIECDGGSSSENSTPVVRVPIISSVSSGNAIKPPKNVQQPVNFPAIRIKSEFGSFNFADDHNSLTNVVPPSDRPVTVGNVRIKTEKVFETDDYRPPVLYSIRENSQLCETERDSSDVGMAAADSSLNLSESEKSACNEDKENDTADLIISRVESIKTEFEPSVTLLNPFAAARASHYPQSSERQTSQDQIVGCTQNMDMNETTGQNSENSVISSNQVVPNDNTVSRDKEDNVNEDQLANAEQASNTELPMSNLEASLDDEECVLVPNSDTERVDDFLDLVSDDDSLSLDDADLDEEIERSTANSKDITKCNENEIKAVDHTDTRDLVSESNLNDVAKLSENEEDKAVDNIDSEDLISEANSVCLRDITLDAEVEESANRLQDNLNVKLPEKMSSLQNSEEDINFKILSSSREEVSKINKLNEDTLKTFDTSEIKKNEAPETMKPVHVDETILELSCDKYEHLDKEAETNIISEEITNLPPIESLVSEENIRIDDKPDSYQLENNDNILEDSFELVKDAPEASTSTNQDLNSDLQLPAVENHEQLISMNASSTSVSSELKPLDIVKSHLENLETAPSTSHNINEIAENHNNANIEKQLQNEFDDISSNSNLDFDESTVGSLSEI